MTLSHLLRLALLVAVCAMLACLGIRFGTDLGLAIRHCK